MDICSATASVQAQLHSNGRSTKVPPGLARRELDLPPGIAKKIAAGGVAPDGIAKRFPAAAPPASPPPASASAPAGEETDAPPGVDILV